MNIYSTVCNILPSRATEQRERETSIEDCSFFMCLSQYLSFLKVINWVRLSQAFSSISPVKLANEKRTNGSSVDWCETQCYEQECVCVFMWGTEWGWQSSREAIVHVVICDLPLAASQNLWATCWLTQAAAPGCHWRCWSLIIIIMWWAIKIHIFTNNFLQYPGQHTVMKWSSLCQKNTAAFKDPSGVRMFSLLKGRLARLAKTEQRCKHTHQVWQ